MSELENTKSQKKETSNLYYNWFYQKILEIIVIILLAANIYFQFWNDKHSFNANIRNVSIMSDSTYVEVVFFNDGDFDELIKKTGFYFVTPTKQKPVTDTYWTKNTLVRAGERYMFELKYQTFDNRNSWQLGIIEPNSCNVDVYFYLITMNADNIEHTVCTKIGHINNDFKFCDYTPVLLDIIKPHRTRRIDSSKVLKTK